MGDNYVGVVAGLAICAGFVMLGCGGLAFLFGYTDIGLLLLAVLFGLCFVSFILIGVGGVAVLVYDYATSRANA